MKFFSSLALSALLAASFTAAPAWAAHTPGANSCYTPGQWQAEELLRLHSELMVVAVTCRQDSEGQNLGSEYGDFTKKNITVLHDAEQTIKGFYSNSQKGDPTDRLDRLRTILANEYGQKSADMGSSEFCAAYRDYVTKMDKASPADVENEVERMKISERSYAKPCVVK